MPPVSQRRDGLPEPDAGGSEAGPARCWRLLLALAGRSLAACLFCFVPAAAERDQREPEYNDGSSRARVLADCHFLPPCFLEIRGTKYPDRRWLGLPDRDDRPAFASLGCLNCEADWNGTEWAESEEPAQCNAR